MEMPMTSNQKMSNSNTKTKMLKNKNENDEAVESEHLDDEDPDAAGPENEQAESEHEDLQEKDDGKAEDVDDYEEDKVKSKKSKVMSKQAQHHSETNDNDDEIVKKEHFRETGGGEEGSVRETATSARSSSSCASFTTSSKNTPKLTPSDSPLLIDTTSVQFDNLLPVSPAAPKHETVLVDTSVPLFDDSIFFNADFSSRFLSRRRPSSQSFFVDHGYSISDHLVSKRHLLPLPFCGEEGVGLAQTIISSVVSAFSTTSDSRHENSFGPSSTFSFTPISQNIYNRTDNPASLFIPPSPTPQQAASAPSPLSTLLNLCPHEMFTLTSDDLPMVDHLLRKGFTQFNPPASGSPNAALNRDETLGTTLLSLVALSLPFELSEENDTLILQHGHMLSPPSSHSIILTLPITTAHMKANRTVHSQLPVRPTLTLLHQLPHPLHPPHKLSVIQQPHIRQSVCSSPSSSALAERKEGRGSRHSLPQSRSTVTARIIQQIPHLTSILCALWTLSNRSSKHSSPLTGPPRVWTGIV
ncbi:hypothetical protein BLNAU_19471 [Blattamonas nauphoetae]|uniref:Uncharacterized protein n=1 Tax=Blattamonas nauphoetae TaxID=2049346 RepID=A0ABQ9X1E6_9EUKA|nr:hypothetical protein BLNAU_19471 [Blattamonas nauphoetae]